MEQARLGDKVKDKVTGFTGVVEAHHKFLFGCNRMSVRPEAIGNTMKEDATFDIDSLEVLKAEAVQGVEQHDCPINLGDEVEDTLSGFKGVVVMQSFYLCSSEPRCGVQAKAKGGDEGKFSGFHASQLKVTKKAKMPKQNQSTGGPQKMIGRAVIPAR